MRTMKTMNKTALAILVLTASMSAAQIAVAQQGESAGADKIRPTSGGVHGRHCRGAEQAILDLYAATNAAFVARDLDAWAEFYTDDVVAFYPNAPLVRGLAAVKAGVAPLFADPHVSVDVVPDVIEVARSCDMAVAYGHGLTRITDPASGLVLVEHSKWVTMLKKQHDGSWKASADIFNADGPLAPE